MGYFIHTGWQGGKATIEAVSDERFDIEKERRRPEWEVYWHGLMYTLVNRHTLAEHSVETFTTDAIISHADTFDFLELGEAIEAEYERFEQESPTGAALAHVAGFDVWLQERIERKIVPSSRDDARSALRTVLSDFRRRIEMGFAPGLYDQTDRCGLHTVRKIRNNFAHEERFLNFEDEPIAQWCRGLPLREGRCPDTLRERYADYLRQVRSHIRQTEREYLVREEFQLGEDVKITHGPVARPWED